MKEIVDQKNCQVCGTILEFDADYDSQFCPACNEWKDEPCGKKSCEFCGKRPEKPVTEPNQNLTPVLKTETLMNPSRNKE